MAAPSIFASPALPSELLRYVIHHCVYPTTLVVCSSREDFFSSVADDIANPPLTSSAERTSRSGPELITASLQQLGVAKHIQTVFIPTVSHFRAYLSVFSAGLHKVPPPPSAPSSNPRLIVYGFLDMHRDTSEWTAQALSNTAAILLETTQDLKFHAVLIEPRGAGEEAQRSDALLDQVLPILQGSATRNEEGEWTGRTVNVRRVLGRWFQFKEVTWKR